MSSPYSPQPLPSQYGQTYQQPAPPLPQPPFPQPAEKSGCGCGMLALLGCGGLLVVSVVACAGGMWWVGQNADKWVVGLGRELIVSTIDASEIPAQEKTEVIAQVDRVVTAYKARQINQQDLERIFEEFQESPIFVMISAWGAEKAYLDPSGLSDEEKEAGRRLIARAMRGIYEKKITQEQLAEILPEKNEYRSKVEVKFENGERVVTKEEGPPKKLTDDEVRDMLTELKQLVDEAEIPDEPFEIDIGDEVKKAVDAALQGKAGP